MTLVALAAQVRAGSSDSGVAVKKHVLVLQTHGPTAVHGVSQAEGVRAALEDRFGSGVAIFDEYLQLSARNDPSSRRAWRDFLRNKYENVCFDAIALIDSGAVSFWLEQGEQISAGTPVVFSGLVEAPEELSNAPFAVTGVMERLDIAGTMELIRRVMPERRRLVVVTTRTEHGVVHRRLVDEAAARLGGFEIVHLQGPLDTELVRATEVDEENTACLYISGWATAESGEVVHPAKLLLRRDRVPVFAQYESVVRAGALGGSVILAKLMGEQAGAMLVRVLEGEDPREITIEGWSPTQEMLDWRQMRRWGISRSELSEDAIVVQPPVTWIERNARVLTYAGAALVAVNLAVPWAIVVIVSRNNRLRRRAEAQRERAISELRESRDGIESLLAAASQLQPLRSEREVLQEMVDAIRATGWSMVLAGLYAPGWTRSCVAHAGFSPEDALVVETQRPSPERLEALFAPERETFKVSRSYFVPGERAGELDIERVASRCGAVENDGRRWTADDVAYIPMVDSAGRVIGAISIDGPASGLRPTEATFRHLEFFADLAARRIEHLRLDAEQRAAAEARCASESYLAGIAESLPGMVYRAIISPDEMVRYPYQSGRAPEFYGRMPDDAKPLDRIGEFCPAEDGERLRAQVRHSLATLEPMDIQYRIVSADGTERWVHGLAKARRLENGDTVFDGIVLDITRQKHAEQALQESRARLEAVARNLPGIVYRFVVTPDMVVHYPFLSQGRDGVYPAGAIETKPFARLGEYLVAEDQRRFQSQTLRCIESLEPLDLQMRVRHPEGEERWIHVVASVSRLANGDTAFDGIALDVTDKKRSERALLESEKRYYTLYDSNPLPVIVFDASTLQVLDVNAAAEAQYGYTREEFTQLTMCDIHAAEDVEKLRGAAVSQGFPAVCSGTNWRHCRRDGTEFDASVRSHSVRLGDVDVCVSITQDVTEIRRAEAARRESEERFRQIAESIREVFWLSTADGQRALYLSPAFEQVWGISASAIYESIDALVESVHPEDRARFIEAFGGMSNSAEVEYRIVRPDGSIRWIHDRGFPVLDENGTCIRIAGIAEDITHRKLTDEQLARGRAQLEAFVEHTPAAVAMFDRGMRYIQCSRRWMTDYNLGDRCILGKTHYEVFPEIGDSWKQVHQRCMSGNVEQCTEDLFVRGDGSEQWLRWEVRPWYETDGTIGGVLMLTEDITARRESEASLRRYAETQRLLLQELDHRVKNAMAGLLAMIDLSAPTYSTIEEFASAVRRRIRAMSEVHAMLSESRWAPVDLRRMAMSLSPQDAAGRVELIGPNVSVPPRQATALGMIIQELMSNATKYGALRQEGGVVQVEWKLLGQGRDGGAMVHLAWRERCPQACVIEGKAGLGTSLVRGFARSELRGSVAMRITPHGVEHEFSLTFDQSIEPDSTPKLAA